MAPTVNKLCKTCGAKALPIKIIPGSFIAELMIWILFIFIALALNAWWAMIIPFVYTIWRASSGKFVCSNCSSESIIPLDSPAANEIIENQGEKPCPFCAEIVKAKAIICKHCGKELPLTDIQISS